MQFNEKKRRVLKKGNESWVVMGVVEVSSMVPLFVKDFGLTAFIFKIEMTWLICFS